MGFELAYLLVGGDVPYLDDAVQISCDHSISVWRKGYTRKRARDTGLLVFFLIFLLVLLILHFFVLGGSFVFLVLLVFSVLFFVLLGLFLLWFFFLNIRESQ